jgi:NAD-dependent histone deacetylase SIR2
MDVSKRYPSPISSAVPSGSASPIKSCDASDTTDEIRVRTDGTDEPPRKRRRIVAPPAPRTTSYIDLEAGSEEEDAQLEKLLVALRRKKRIVVIAGAGISVSAGSECFSCRHDLLTSLLTTISSRFPLIDWTFRFSARPAQAKRFREASFRRVCVQTR